MCVLIDVFICIYFIDCVEKKIWLILRHGTRYPGKKDVPRIINELPQLQHMILRNYENNITSLSVDDAALFEKWKLPLAQRDMMKLTEEGQNEMIDLGERYQARFPSLMPEAFNNQTYRVRIAKYSIILCIYMYVCLLAIVNFSLDILPLNVQKRARSTLLLVYLVGVIAKIFGFQRQYIEIQS